MNKNRIYWCEFTVKGEAHRVKIAAPNQKRAKECLRNYIPDAKMIVAYRMEE